MDAQEYDHALAALERENEYIRKALRTAEEQRDQALGLTIHQKQLLELLMYRVEVMRESQVDYFRLPTDGRRKKAIGLETAVDKALKELKRRAYSTDALRAKYSQPGLFEE